MQGNERKQDLDAAEEVLGWFILSHHPELSIVTSRSPADSPKACSESTASPA
ncbi:MAG: hypothetical protein OXJ90_18560 [Spirochaetaceae bacterium]|nr:hypothetical protein [Spirochaetaceae bacterium]